MCSGGDPLKEFLFLVPYGDRQKTSNLILRVRKELTEQIETRAQIGNFIQSTDALKSIFMHTPLSLRSSLKKKLFEAMKRSLDSCESLAVFTILLSVIELGAVRNSNRCELEASDIISSLRDVNEIIVFVSSRFRAKRSNILSLYAWVVGMLAYTYRMCLIWCASQDCCDLSVTIEEYVPLADGILGSPSMPRVLNLLLTEQLNERVKTTTSSKFTLNALALASAVSDDTLKYISELPHERCTGPRTLENADDIKCLANLQFEPVTQLNGKAAKLPSIKEFRSFVEAKDISQICNCIHVIEHKILDNTPFNDDSKQLFVEVTILAPLILNLLTLHEKWENTNHGAFSYASLLCGFLKIWNFLLEKKMALKNMPQSYLYLAAFVNPRFHIMNLPSMAQSMVLQAQFLTNYLGVFRSSVLSSPHWFLQMMTDIICAVFDRLETAISDSELESIEMTVCPCIAAVSRTLSSLRADEPEFRPELSRALKGLLDTIVVRIATFSFSEGGHATGATKRKWQHPDSELSILVAARNEFRERAVLSPRVRNMLNSGLLYPLIQSIDPWALQQSRIGLKPPAAREVLQKLVADFSMKYESADMPRGRSRMPHATAAVSGLNLKAKVSRKRNRQF